LHCALLVWRDARCANPLFRRRTLANARATARNARERSAGNTVKRALCVLNNSKHSFFLLLAHLPSAASLARQQTRRS